MFLSLLFFCLILVVLYILSSFPYQPLDHTDIYISLDTFHTFPMCFFKVIFFPIDSVRQIVINLLDAHERANEINPPPIMPKLIQLGRECCFAHLSLVCVVISVDWRIRCCLRDFSSLAFGQDLSFRSIGLYRQNCRIYFTHN